MKEKSGRTAGFIALLSLALTLAGSPVSAEIRLPDILGSNMVLQRGQPVPVWGKADPGEKIRVGFKSMMLSATADGNGDWKVVLDPMEASAQPADMTITGKNEIRLTGILIGEVWLCTGQSNMQWRLLESDGGQQAIQAADYPEIRLFNVSRERSFKRKPGPIGEWQACSPESVPEFSGIGYFFGLELYKKLGIPIGLVNASYGGSQAEAWTPVEYLAASEDLKPCIEREKIWAAERPAVQARFDSDMAEWRSAAEKARADGTQAPRQPRVPDALRDYRIAASIYNNMIGPLIPFAIRGALWYQGESNEERAEQYELLLPVMIRAWRERWGQGDFPFGIIQLPNFRAVSVQPEDQAWSHVRDAQRMTFLNTPQTGLIVTIDVGEAADIHPTNKLDVGHRCYLWAMADVYKADLTKSGPVFKSARKAGRKMILVFDEVGKGLKICQGDELKEFAVAGADRKWHWAEARIKGKDKVIVRSDEVSNPVAVRYAFNNNPENPNLSNDTCLPAVPFRTDRWEGPTHGKR